MKHRGSSHEYTNKYTESLSPNHGHTGILMLMIFFLFGYFFLHWQVSQKRQLVERQVQLVEPVSAPVSRRGEAGDPIMGQI